MRHRDYMTVQVILPVPINKIILNILTKLSSLMQNSFHSAAMPSPFVSILIDQPAVGLQDHECSN